MTRRVVITECAAITPIGNNKRTILDNLIQKKSGVCLMRDDHLLTDKIHCKVFGTVNYPIDYDFKRQHRKTMGPVSYYACQTVKEVLEKSGLSNEFITSGQLGVAFGSIHGSPSVQRNIYKSFFSEDSQKLKHVGAVEYLKSMVHTTAVNITKMFGITGRVISSSTACTTSSQSIGFGYETIKFGLQDAMICGGADEYDTTTVAVFDNLMACSTDFNETPHLTPRPFDRNRDGLVVAEGAGALLLEEYEFAKKRGANIIAEVIGFGCNNNGGDLILPNMDGITQTIRLGLDSAKITPDTVDFISSHATGTKMGDVIEAQAIGRVYGTSSLVTAFKSYLGHTMAACGAIEVIFSLYMMENKMMVPTLNLSEVDPRCDIIQHTPEIMDKKLGTIAVQNFAFGGVNTSLVLKKID